MNWAQRQRIGFIGDRLMAGQMIQRADLVAKFDISIPQASLDIRAFNAAHPGAMRYDRKKRGYVAHNITAPSRDTTAAAKGLMEASNDWLQEVALRDPSMIRDVAAALIFERNR